MNLFKNHAEIIGNLGDNPKYLLSTQNQPRYTFDLCTNKAYKEGDEWKSKSTWIKCVAWGNNATTLSRMQFGKGDRVQVEGELRNNDWVNNQNGEEHHEIYLQISEMRKMAKTSRNPENKSNEQAQKSKPDYRLEEERQIQRDVDDLPF